MSQSADKAAEKWVCVCGEGARAAWNKTRFVCGVNNDTRRPSTELLVEHYQSYE